MNPHVAHRGGLATRIRRLTPDPQLFSQVGGRDVVGTLVDELYDRIHADARLKPKFTNSTAERENQKKFFEEWLGGEPLYSQHVASAGLRQRHTHIHINADDAQAWLGHLRAAMEVAGIGESNRRSILQTLRPLAEAFVNEERDAAGEPATTRVTDSAWRRSGSCAARRSTQSSLRPRFRAVESGS